MVLGGASFVAHAVVASVSAACLIEASRMAARGKVAASERARRRLAVGWGALAALSAADGLALWAIVLGGDAASFASAALAAAAMLLPLASCAFAAYLAYLLRGDHRLDALLFVTHAAIAGVFFLVVGWVGPPEFSTTGPLAVKFARMPPTWLVASLVALAAAPLAALAGGYVVFAARVLEPGMRRRPSLLAGALACWLGGRAVAGLLVQGVPLEGPIVLASMGLGLVPALLVVAAYHPPGADRVAHLAAPRGDL